MRNHVFGFLLWLAAVLGVFSSPLSRLIWQALHEGYTSHIVLIPPLICFLIWSRRDAIFASINYSVVRGIEIAAFGVLAGGIAFGVKLENTSSLIPLLTVLSVLLLVIAGFVLFFGTRAIARAAFPIALLVFILPIPGVLIDNIIRFLQARSTDLSAWAFSVLGVPVLREGFVLTMPEVSIEIAKECSGINSSIALLIIMLLIAHETLHTTWRRVLLVLITIPLSIIKNAMRIMTLTMLASRIDPSFLSGRLHHDGGFVFYLLSLALVYPVWKLLHATETSQDIRAAEQRAFTA